MRLEQKRIFESNVFILSMDPNLYDFSLEIDSGFLDQEICVEPGGLLIDFKKTAELWERPAGETLYKFILSMANDSLAFCPTNWGWQLGVFLIRQGKLLCLKNEDKKITNNFDTICLINNMWISRNLEILAGQSQTKILDTAIGFSMPLLVKDQKVVSLKNILGDPRCRADYRNIFDFGFGKGPSLPAQYWVLIRKLLPTTLDEALMLFDNKKITISTEKLGQEDYLILQKIIKSFGLAEKLKIFRKESTTFLIINDKLLKTRLPLIGIGHDKNGWLLVICVDGRQTDSWGLTVEELAELAQQKGAINFGLGSAGGDVALVQKSKKGFNILNSPSNLNGALRPSPSALIIMPKD